MNRIILTALALWVLLLSPGLCLAGTLEHFCSDCPQSTTCDHEDDCADDPCGVSLLRPDVSQGFTGSAAGIAPNYSSQVPDRQEWPKPVGSAARRNLPLPPSDLPLLN